MEWELKYERLWLFSSLFGVVSPSKMFPNLRYPANKFFLVFMVFILTAVKAAYVHIFLHKLFNVQTCLMSDSLMT